MKNISNKNIHAKTLLKKNRCNAYNSESHDVFNNANELNKNISRNTLYVCRVYCVLSYNII